jgi:Predicted permease
MADEGDEAAATLLVTERQRAVMAASAEGRLRFWSLLLLRLALAVVAIYVLWRVRTVVTTVVVALVLASAVGALVRPLTRIRIPFLRPRVQRTIATALVFAVLLAATVASVRLMIHPFELEWNELQQNWPKYQSTLAAQINAAQAWYANLNLPPEVRQFIEERLSVEAVPSPGAWVASLLGRTVSWASHIVELLLIPVLAFYFTLDARELRSELLFLVPKARQRSTLAILSESSAIMRDYVVAQFWLAVIAGVVTGVGLSLIGMKYALILGIFAGVTRAIPVIGPLLGGIPLATLAFVYGAQAGQPWLWIWVVGFFTLLHLVESKIIMPKFLGHRLHLHAAIIIVALLVGGEFFGLMGMFLAAPVAALARVLIMHYVVIPRRRRERAAREGAARTGATNGGGRVLRLERALRIHHTPSAPGPPPPAPVHHQEDRTA